MPKLMRLFVFTAVAALLSGALTYAFQLGPLGAAGLGLLLGVPAGLWGSRVD